MIIKPSEIAGDKITVIDAEAIGTASGTDGHVVEIDFGQLLPSEFTFTIGGKTVTDASTAPGAADTVTVNQYWSDESVSTGSAATLLADRKVAGSAKTLTNTAATTQYWGFAAEQAPKARFLYITVDNTAIDAAVDLDVFIQPIKFRSRRA